MSKSRLEKFLYALYSLDSSDLPEPLSRIEELYKCWVTGEEAPTFEPISRVEKYLMAILGGYDLNELPNPISRVEVLLYKLATGDDNLDDVKSFLSEHEELLAEIIRNGGAGGNIDIEYVLYSLSTEFNTLYNTAEKPVKSAVLKGQTLVNLLSKSNINVKSSNTYRINYTHNLNTTKTYILQYRINQIPELSDTTDSARLLKFEWYSGNKYGGYSDIFIRDITVGNDNFIMINPFNDEVTKTYFGIWCPNYVSGSLDMDIILIEYQNSMENRNISYFTGIQSVRMPVLTTSNEDGTKTNILTVNEPVELHGIGEVRDELNLLTGELTQRVGTLYLANEYAGIDSDLSKGSTVFINLGVRADEINEYPPILSNTFETKNLFNLDEEGILYDGWGLYVRVLKSRITELTNDSIVQYLKAIQSMVFYRKKVESVKTVDLSVVDQDGNNTKLKTFNDITHVTLSSEGLIPEVELEVATKNKEVLSTMSLEMDDVSATQTTLEETSNTQSENVDATMIATTEIYEELL